MNYEGLAPVRHRDKKFIQVFFEYSFFFTCNNLSSRVFDLGCAMSLGLHVTATVKTCHAQLWVFIWSLEAIFVMLVT